MVTLTHMHDEIVKAQLVERNKQHSEADPIPALAEYLKRSGAYQDRQTGRIDLSKLYQQAITSYEELNAIADPEVPYYSDKAPASVRDLYDPVERIKWISTYVKSWRQAADVLPSAHVIESQYVWLLSGRSGAGISGVEQFYEATGVKPTEQALMVYFERRLSTATRLSDDANFEVGWIGEEIKRISELFGAAPSPALIKETIHKMVSEARVPGLLRLCEALGVGSEQIPFKTSLIVDLVNTGKIDQAKRLARLAGKDFEKEAESILHTMLAVRDVANAVKLKNTAGLSDLSQFKSVIEHIGKDLSGRESRTGFLTSQQIRTLISEFGLKLQQTNVEQYVAETFVEGQQINSRLFSDAVVLFKELGFQLISEDLAKRLMMLPYGETFAQQLVFEHKARTLWSDIWPKSVPFVEWGGAVDKLVSLQAPAERAEYDPWKTDLAPLLRFARSNQLLQFTEAKDGDLLVEFVKEFGMNHLPHLFRLFIAIKRFDRTAEQAGVINGWLSELGITFNESAPGKTVTEIKRAIKNVQLKLVRDEDIEFLADRPITSEIVQQLIGRSSWDRGVPIHQMSYLYQQTKETNPAAFTLPEGYEPVTFQVPVLQKVEQNEEAIAQEQLSVLNNPEVVARGAELSQAFLRAESLDNLAAWWEATRTRLVASLNHDLQQVRSVIDVEGNPKKKIGLERKAQALEKNVARIEALQAPQLDEANAEDSDRATISFINAVCDALSDVPSGKDLILAVTAMHILRKINPGMRERLKKGIQTDQRDKTNKESVNAWSEFLVQYLNEHYLHPSQDPAHTGHEPLSKSALKQLQSAWGVKPDVQKNPLVIAQKRLEAIDRHGSVAGDKSVSVSLYPVKGFLRVYGGNLGDACYTSQASLLAEGKFPDLSAFVFVTGEASGDPKLQGSVLAIETKTPDGKGVLMVRANNPKQRLLAQVDPEQLTLRTLEEMRKLAQRRGLDFVVVPLDRASESSSNRPEVSGAYSKHFVGRNKIQLENTYQTNFNGYANWSANGAYPVVDVTNA